MVGFLQLRLPVSPHLRLAASAATSATDASPCALAVNGVSLMSGCGLDALVVGTDGVCAAALDPPNQPRAACFDTKVQGRHSPHDPIGPHGTPLGPVGPPPEPYAGDLPNMAGAGPP